MKTSSFGIYANQTDKRWNTFIEEMELSREVGGKLPVTNNHFYGISLNGLITHSCFDTQFGRIITLDDYFAEGSVYRCVDKPTFKRGDRILVWDEDQEARERIALCYINDACKPVIVVQMCDEDKFFDGSEFFITTYKHWKPLPKENPERQKLQQEIEQLEKELNVKRDKLKEV